MGLDLFDLSGISLGNLPNIISMKQSDGWTIVTEGLEVWAFRMGMVYE